MGYIGFVKKINKKNKRISIDGKGYYYGGVTPFVDGPSKVLKRGDRVSYSYAGDNITWIGLATPEYIRMAKELKQRYGGMKPKQQKAILKNAIILTLGKLKRRF